MHINGVVGRGCDYDYLDLYLCDPGVDGEVFSPFCRGVTGRGRVALVRRGAAGRGDARRELSNPSILGHRLTGNKCRVDILGVRGRVCPAEDRG